MTAITSPANSSKRINVVDSLRGFAVAGIIMIHFIEHMNFYNFPEQTAFDQGLWDTIMFLGSSKMYAIFSLLFGLSCFIQHDNQEKKGNDFRPRFAWRMVLLFCWGLLDLVFYNGDILGTYAVLGLFLIPLIKAPSKLLLGIAIFLFLQPVEIGYMIAGAINPDLTPLSVGTGQLWGKVYGPCAEGSFLDTAIANLTYGLHINFGWAIENGRFTQTLYLFILGMLLGRKRLFLNEGENMKFWKRVLICAVAGFAVTQILYTYVPGQIESRTIARSARTLINMWRSFSMTSFYVSGIVLLYYNTGAQKALDRLACIGKMSLSCYLLQSIVGGFLFFHYGLGLYSSFTHSMSFGLCLVFLVALYFFCRWWTSHHRRGPLEEIWARLTWIGAKK